jgi:hypothetical protein
VGESEGVKEGSIVARTHHSYHAYTHRARAIVAKVVLLLEADRRTERKTGETSELAQHMKDRGNDRKYDRKR